MCAPAAILGFATGVACAWLSCDIPNMAGGAYMVELWRLMEEGTLAKTFGCLMINVHPKVKCYPT
jgi:hypothetical protein